MKKALLCSAICLILLSYLTWQVTHFTPVEKGDPVEIWDRIFFLSARPVTEKKDKIYFLLTGGHGMRVFRWLPKSEFESHRQESFPWAQGFSSTFFWGHSVGRKGILDEAKVLTGREFKSWKEFMEWWKGEKKNLNPSTEQILNFARLKSQNQGYRNLYSTEMERRVKKLNQRSWWKYHWWCYGIEAVYFMGLIIFLFYGLPRLWKWVRFLKPGFTFRAVAVALFLHFIILLPHLYGYAHNWATWSNRQPPQAGWILYQELVYYSFAGPLWKRPTFSHPQHYKVERGGFSLRPVLDTLFYPFLFYLSEPRWPILNYDPLHDTTFRYEKLIAGFLLWGGTALFLCLLVRISLWLQAIAENSTGDL